MTVPAGWQAPEEVFSVGEIVQVDLPGSARGCRFLTRVVGEAPTFFGLLPPEKPGLLSALQPGTPLRVSHTRLRDHPTFCRLKVLCISATQPRFLLVCRA